MRYANLCHATTMPTYKTPGVYVEEISGLPPSVAEVETAIPAFIGYTAKGEAGAVEIAVVDSWLDYDKRFGSSPPTAFTADAAGVVAAVDPLPARLLGYALQLYFANGGGRCTVVSVDHTSSPLARSRFEAGLAALARADEPTLIVMPEVVLLAQADCDDLNRQALAQCAKRGDRFAILDVRAGDVSAARDGYGAANLKYGAAYHPYLATRINHRYDEAAVTVGDANTTLASLEASDNALYNRVKANIAQQCVTLPPSAAIAGVYARVDRDRGVWKAPANVGLSAIVGPAATITAQQQEALNVDAVAGKSINAIRAFAGRGTLVWGARTLAGNDNEWRYVNVRRLCIMIEESIRKSTAYVVFEPNDANTWLKLKAMLDNYLNGLWRRGALQGAKPEQAFFVNVGLGRTMSAQDVLEGWLIVEVGIAAARPAEFIVMSFAHKLAQP